MANLRWTPLLACSVGGAGICSLLLNSVTNAIYWNNISLSQFYNFSNHNFSVTGLLTDFKSNLLPIVKLTSLQLVLTARRCHLH